MTKLERIGVVATGPLQLLLTAASMVGCTNAIVGGVALALALALRSLLAAPVPVATVAGALVGLGLAAVCFGYQVRRFGRAAAVVPQLYEGQSPDMPGWPTA
jgi:cytochrome bd-type quinol oxidase subunit 1